MVDWLCTYGTCLQSRATPPDKKDELCEKMMNFGFKMMNCVLEMANFVLEMMNFALDLMNFVPAPGKIPMRHSGKQILASFVDNRMSIAKADSRPQPEFVIEMMNFLLKMMSFVIKIYELCILNDEFGARCRHDNKMRSNEIKDIEVETQARETWRREKLKK